MQERRPAGQVGEDGKYVVLVESFELRDHIGGLVHVCGTGIQRFPQETSVGTIAAPFCPRCEKLPQT